VTTVVVRTGGVVDDIPLLHSQPMPFDAVASRDTECVTLTRERWTELLHHSPDLALRWMTSIARRLDDDRRRLVVVMSRPLVALVAYLLLDMAEDAPDGRSVVRLSHITMAQLLGVRRQSVTRMVGDLKQRGLVDSRYGGPSSSTSTACARSWAPSRCREPGLARCCARGENEEDRGPGLAHPRSRHARPDHHSGVSLKVLGPNGDRA